MNDVTAWAVYRWLMNKPIGAKFDLMAELAVSQYWVNEHLRRGRELTRAIDQEHWIRCASDLSTVPVFPGDTPIVTDRWMKTK